MIAAELALVSRKLSDGNATHNFLDLTNEGDDMLVDVDAFDWHLEGSGDKRVLILDLEKVMGGLDWPDLLKR